MDLYGNYVDQLCRKYVRKNDRVFDCGCGGGSHTEIICRYSGDVIGGDFDNRLEKKYSINFRKIGINSYGQENEFNVVTAFDVIEHVEDDQSFLVELIRLTKAGGVIIIGTPNRNRLSNKIISILKGKITYPYKVGYHFESGGDILHLREYTKKDLKNLAEKIGNGEVIKTYSSFLGLYIPKIGPVGSKALNVRFFKKYCQHLFLVLRKK